MTDQANRQPKDKICAYEYTVRRGDSFYLIAHRLGVPLRDLLEANSDVNPARLMVGDVLCIPMEEDDRPQPAAPQAPQETQPAPEPAPQPAQPTQPAQPAQPAQPVQPVQPVQPAPDTQQPADGVEDDMDSLDQPAQPAPDASADAAAPSEPLDPAFSVCPESNRRTIQEGETITDVQLDTNMTLHTLQTANPETDLDSLTAGQVLCVPDANIPCDAPQTTRLTAGDTIESVALRLNTSVGALLRANPCLAPSDFREGTCINLPR